MTGMKSLTGTRTHENLKLAFAAESQANRRYHAGRFTKALEDLKDL
jgi:hypothetical protein